MQLRIVAHDDHFSQPANSQSLFFKNNASQSVSNERCLHLNMFSMYSCCNHTRSTSLATLQQLCRWRADQAYPHSSTAFSKLLDVLDFAFVHLFL